MKSEWQPIETAPKDGIGVLIFVPRLHGFVADQRVIAAHWSGWGGGVWEANSGCGKFSTHEATHWMPLPPPPA